MDWKNILAIVEGTITGVGLITLVLAILGYFGVQTTSFAALLAGAGLAIGSAWGGPAGELRGGHIPGRVASV